MSSHREAPEISKDPVADNTDLYAFVSPDKPDTVTIIANFIPFQNPQGGPNFYEFGDDVLYTINISNTEDILPNVSYQFRFTTKVRNEDTYLYNTGPISSVADPERNWNRPQFYSVTRTELGMPGQVLGRNLTCPPVNVGPRSTPNYAHFTAQAVHRLTGGRKVFAGQRSDAFHVDLGSVFDLGTLRPFQNLHLIPSAAAAGVNGTQGLNVHSIAIQVPKTDLTRGGVMPTDAMAARSVVGVWATASRRKSRIYDEETGASRWQGPFQQVSRLGNPLVNEVVIPMGDKDPWNARRPRFDEFFGHYLAHPELAKLLPVLYPGVFPHLAAYTKVRADLLAILHTGIPAGIIPGFQNFTGPRQADMLRLNLAIPPTAKPNRLGLVGGDPAGFPNGRRIKDDAVTVELRAIAGLTIPLVDPSFTPDGAANIVKDGTKDTNLPLLDTFPYLGNPAGGYQTKPGVPAA
ncbi:MAG TPA: DUF4331 domain-containing protein [Dermatophilaceae bacterium]|nr:DUF4331 domain-containing protein [Dermatophilaceae bacterium]